MAMDWVMILVAIVAALVGGLVGGELASRRNRAAMVHASARLHVATAQVREVQRTMAGRQ
jgi:uncharacterized protein YneF (UPF0154 family)